MLRLEAPMAQESFSDYHLYTLGRKTTINNNETKQVSMLTGTGVPVRKRYVVEGQAFYYRNAQHPGSPIKDVVQVYYQFKNEERGGLGMPMPAGVVRVYQADSKGGTQFVGEDRIDHTPKDEELNLKIGNAFDVACERKQIDFEKIASNVYELEYEITLRNHKTAPVTVEVNEPIGGTWRMLRSSHEWNKTAAWAAAFAVPVAADATAVLKYRVRVFILTESTSCSDRLTRRCEKRLTPPLPRLPLTDPAEVFRALHLGSTILVLPNAWDAASARLIEAEGFPAIATTSAGVAAALGYPDGGVVPSNEMIEAIARIARAVKVPVTADIEHAYAATPDAVADVVLRVIAAGAVGINLEDCVPGATELEPLALQIDKITAIIKAATKAGVRVVINARTDGFLRGFGAPDARLGVAIERGKAFLAAGADCVFVPGVRDRDTIGALVRGIGGPINVLAVDGTPPIAELEALGVARVSLGSGPMRATMAVMRDIARELKTTGTYRSFTKHQMSFNEVEELMR